jgi:ankyrin repeat protein
MARNKDGWTALQSATVWGFPETVQALLAAGADAKAKDKNGKTLRDLAQENEKVKGTKGYWALNDARYK